jgi:hypothetical protein
MTQDYLTGVVTIATIAIDLEDCSALDATLDLGTSEITLGTFSQQLIT